MRPKRRASGAGRWARAAAVVVAAMPLALAAVAGGCGGGGHARRRSTPSGSRRRPPPASTPGLPASPASLLVTADGGATWKRQRFLLPQRGVDVAFTDVQTGWLVTDAGTVLATTDGGAAWTVVEQVEGRT